MKAAQAIARASGQTMAPLSENTDSAPRLQAALSSLLLHTARSIGWPSRTTQAIMKNEPTPGPNTPS
ncbi:hypothetical protein D3C86_2085810 [compost metagenome]